MKRPTRTRITVDRLKVFARHGALPQEKDVGSYFYVTVEAEVTDCQAALTDRLSDTLSYADIARTITEEMAVRSQLLEHVAARIAQRLLADHPSVLSLLVKVTKENPPLGVECTGAGVELIFDR
ncbi:MAG: dihydroneopterin aldolase [Prevotellaceae bacterium]|nr:dihydroneopterin aldolase [Prevotellaceae bacterium]